VSTAAVRFGVLGAAGITPSAIVERARAFAAEHAIPSVEPSYAALVARQDLDAIYVPLPASLHREWCERSLRAGKHVLCEKPLATNTEDARFLVALAKQEGLLLGEAFHYRYHPLMTRVLEIVRSGQLGSLESVEAIFLNALPRELPGEAAVYWDADLGGGAMYHNGCYAAHCLRTLTAAEPEIVSAVMRRFDGTIADGEIDADLHFAGGARGRIRASFMHHDRDPEIWFHLPASQGELHADNFVLPHLRGYGLRAGSIEITNTDGKTHETFPTRPTYNYQLDAFVSAIRNETSFATSGDDIIGNARVIEAVLSTAAATG
jgi:predicted dehydrogenase